MAVISGFDARPVGDARATFGGGETILLAGATLLMLWPALYNGFPLIFSDTGTYISQAMEFHLGWDRPPFYSFFILSLDWGRSLWPPVIVQCAATAWLIRRTQLMIAPQSSLRAGALLLAPLAVLTALPWTAAQIMPDIFTPMMVLAFTLLVLLGRCARGEQIVLMAVICLAIMVHLSNLPIYAGLCLTMLGLRAGFRRRVRWRALLLPFMLGITALSGVNLIASGRFSPSPYGATFLLARLIGDGPARTTLAHDCMIRHWALCRYQPNMPHSADSFLWHVDSPLYQAGGPVRLIGQTKAIVARTIATEPETVLGDAGVDFARQLITFAPGSGLRPWYATAWQTIERDFAPPAAHAFTSSLQAHGRLRVPGWLRIIAQTLAVLGIAVTACFVLTAPVLALRRGSHHPRVSLIDDRLFGFGLIVLLTLLGNAAVTGALSGPHDRYQSRVVWLAVLSGAMVLSRLYSVWRSRPISKTA
ncbi:hypothetical protein [Acidiphilium sp.]|uniref:hypothetical protein n=1 Tax=Acidiphilium sp. TaxID=527 RepID=UPI003D028446